MVLMITGYFHKIFNFKGRSYYFLYSMFTRARCQEKELVGRVKLYIDREIVDR